MKDKANKSEVHESLLPTPEARQRTAEEEKALGIDRTKQPHHDYHNPHSPAPTEYHKALVVGEGKPKAVAKSKVGKGKAPAPAAETTPPPQA